MRNPNISEAQQRALEALPARRERAAYHDKQAAILMALLSRLLLATLLAAAVFMVFAPAAERQAPGLGLEKAGEVFLSMMAVGVLVLFAMHMYHLFKGK